MFAEKTIYVIISGDLYAFSQKILCESLYTSFKCFISNKNATLSFTTSFSKQLNVSIDS